ncbi:MAG: YitT family protein [Clostridia bacterium]|nr:YitT family protein [Clostridia bacterium]
MKKQIWSDMIFVLIGCFLLAFAITAILEPNALITGGITGISLIIGKVTGISYTIFYYMLSLLILLATYLLLGKYEARKILLLSIMFPAILMIFSIFDFRLVEDDLFLAAVYYGIIGGAGVGLILKQGYSTGGTDSVGKILHKKRYPFISINQIITTIDIVIIIISIFAYDLRIALYAILTQLVLLKSVETVMYGLSPKQVKLEIISDAESKISDYILHDIKRGISKYTIIGGYSNISKVKLVTVCSPRESMLIRDFIAEVDDKAFVDILPVMTVWGEGLGFGSIKE